MFKNTKTVVFTSIISAIATAAATYAVLDQNPDLTRADGVLVNGMSYHGNLENGLLQGMAVLEDAAGERYKGNFVDGLMQGPGIYSDGTGGQYTGNFVDGKMNGEGSYTYYHGAIYAGRFKNNAWHGIGNFTQANGDKYSGDFSEGFMHGEGTYVLRDSLSYSGRFDKNEFVSGKAVLSGIVLEGKFSNWTLDGKGKLSDQSGTVTEGVYVKGMINGQGTQTLSDGSQYSGEFKEGSKHGNGKLIDADGNIYTGSFEYDTFHGQGEMLLATPLNEITRISGNWSWGSLENDPRNPRKDYSKNIEKLLYSQNSLLNNALAEVEESNPESSDLFFLGVAGYGKQDVFLKEIRYLRDYIKPYAGSRTITLVNNHKTIDEYPLATRHSIGDALAGIEEKMDVENDILFIYMTSHGSKSHEFSIKLSGLSLPPLNPTELADALKQTKIKWKVIVISSCYSGGFIDELENQDTLVITAARYDRKSFGCSAKSDMTYFGRAYLKDALPKNLSFVQAFYDAEEHVKDRETRDFPKAKHSIPQISLGENMKKKLESWKHPLGS